MVELKDVRSANSLNRSGIEQLICDTIGRIDSIHCVIYNTNEELNFFQRITLRANTGFKRVYSYPGNCGRVDVYTLRLDKQW